MVRNSLGLKKKLNRGHNFALRKKAQLLKTGLIVLCVVQHNRLMCVGNNNNVFEKINISLIIIVSLML